MNEGTTMSFCPDCQVSQGRVCHCRIETDDTPPMRLRDLPLAALVIVVCLLGVCVLAWAREGADVATLLADVSAWLRDLCVWLRLA
jgi:hypothetical protein